MSLVIGIVSLVQCRRYMVYPSDRKDVRRCAELNDKLIELLGKPSIILRSVFQERSITDFWLIETTPAGVPYIERWMAPPQPSRSKPL